MTFDDSSMGFHTFGAFCRPVTEYPPGGNTCCVDRVARDVLAASAEDFPLIRSLSAHTDYFMPPEEEAMALSGMTD